MKYKVFLLMVLLSLVVVVLLVFVGLVLDLAPESLPPQPKENMAAPNAGASRYNPHKRNRDILNSS